MNLRITRHANTFNLHIGPNTMNFPTAQAAVDFVAGRFPGEAVVWDI